MDLSADDLACILGKCAEMLQDLTIHEERLGMCMGESTSREIKECLTTEPMYPTGVTANDIICTDLETRNSHDLHRISDEDIRLIDTCRYLTIGCEHSGYSLKIDTRVGGRESEDVEL